MEADAVNGGDADGAGDDVLDFLQFALQEVISLNHLLAEIVKYLALAGETEFFLAAFDEQRFELALERAYLLADSGLRDFVDLGGLGETFSLGKVAEDFEALYLHKLR